MKVAHGTVKSRAPDMPENAHQDSDSPAGDASSVVICRMKNPWEGFVKDTYRPSPLGDQAVGATAEFAPWLISNPIPT
jgi:hypothetical protein